MKKIVNENELLLAINSGDGIKVDNLIKTYSENDDLLYRALIAFLCKGFVTASSSCGHIYDDWKDPIYIAVYVDFNKRKQLLNFILNFYNSLSDEEKNLVSFVLNYNSEKQDDFYRCECVFGVQINLFEDCEQKKVLLNKVVNSLEDVENKMNLTTVSDFIYILNRFLNYSNATTNWVNITFNANNIDKYFEMIFKKNKEDIKAINKKYYYDDGLEEFEYLLNY